MWRSAEPAPEVFLVLKAGFRKHSWEVRGRGDCPVGEVMGMGDLGFHLCCFSAFPLRVSGEGSSMSRLVFL